MWHIDQLVRNAKGERALYAGYDLTKQPAIAYLRLKGNELELFRSNVKEYKELPGWLIPVGRFCTELRGGFLGEIDLCKLQRVPLLYVSAILTLREGA